MNTMLLWIAQALAVAAVVSTATLVGRRAAKNQPLLLQNLASLSLVGPIAALAVLGLGLTGFASPAGFSSVALAALATIATHRTFLSTNSGAQRSTPWRLAWPAGLGLLAGLGGHLVGRVHPGVHLTPDDLTYHAAWVAELTTRGRLDLFPQNYHAYYPFNAEAFAAFFVVPLGADGLAYVAGLYWLALASLAAWSAVRMAGGGPFPAGLAVIFVTGESATKLTAHSFSAVDLAAPTSLFAAAVLLCTWRVPTPRTTGTEVQGADPNGAFAFGFDLGCLMLVGLLAGMSVGSKISMAVWLVTLLGWLCVLSLRQGEGRRLAWRLLVVAGATAVLGAGWYLRNAWLTGNPVFPGNLGPLKGYWSQEVQTRTTLWYWLTSREAKPWQVMAEHLLHAAQGWTLALSLPLLWLLRRRPHGSTASNSSASAWQRAEVRLAGLLVALSTTQLASYPFMPFSGTNYSTDAELRISSRFIIGALMCVGTLTAIGLARLKRKYQMVLWALAAVAVGEGVAASAYDKPALNGLLTLLLIAGWSALDWFARRLPRQSLVYALDKTQLLSRYAMWCTGAVALGLVSAWHATQARTDKARANLRIHGVPIGLASATMRASAGPVAVMGPAKDSYYPLFGSPYVRRVIVLNDSGQAVTPAAIASESKAEAGNLEHALQRLAVEHLIYAGADGAKPSLQRQMARIGAITELQHPDLTIWRLPKRSTTQER